MRREIATRIDIEAPPATVFRILADFAHYPEWNSFIRWIEGRFAPGADIRFCFELPRGFRFKARATILDIAQDAALRWAGRFLHPRLFRAEHYFRLVTRADGHTHFEHGEIFSGLLLPLAWWLLRRAGTPVYHDMNRALKQRAESRP